MLPSSVPASAVSRASSASATRTPAAVYRNIALNRLPSYTGDDRLGGFSYLIAAAPVAMGNTILITTRNGGLFAMRPE